MSRFAFEAFPQAFDDNGATEPGAKMFVYAAGSTTPATTYSDPTLLFPQSNPIIADAAGLFPQIYMSQNGLYKVRILTADGVLIEEADWVRQGEDNTPSFSTRAELVTYYVANSVSIPTGAVVTAGGMEYIKTGGTGIADMPGLIPYGDVYPDHFANDLTTDAGPAMRAARDYLEDVGGNLHLLGKNYPVTTTETLTVQKITAPGVSGPASINTPLALRGTTGLIGETGKSKITRAGGGIESVVCLVNWTGHIKGIEIEGAGPANNSHHGLIVLSQDTLSYNMDGALFEDLHIHDVGSYGIGIQYCTTRNTTLQNILIEDTGSDSVDWKSRGLSFGDALLSYGNKINNIRAYRPGQRLAGNASGLGIRGPVAIDNVQVYGIPATAKGIVLDPGVSVDPDYRSPAERTVLTNFYCEAANPLDEVVGVEVWACGSVVVSGGITSGCSVKSFAATSSPYEMISGGSISNVIVIGVRGSNALIAEDRRTHFTNCRVASEIQTFSFDRLNVTDGQTVLPIVNGTGSGSSTLVVRKNGNPLTLTTDYTIQSNTVTLVVPMDEGADDVVDVIFPALRAVRITADYCSVVGGGCDEWTETGISFSTSTFETSGTQIGFMQNGKVNISEQEVSGLGVVTVSGPAGADIPIRLQGRGSGAAEVNRLLLLSVPTASAGLASGTVWSDGGTLKIIP